MFIENEKALGQAVKNGEDTIEIEGDLSRKVVKIKATGNVAWAVCFASFSVAIVSLLATPATGGTSSAITLLTGTAAAATLGLPAALAAIGIAVGGGSAAVLNKLRKYRLVKKGDTSIVLYRK